MPKRSATHRSVLTLALILSLLLGALAPPPAAAAPIACSVSALRAAINAANGNGPGLDTIDLAAGCTYTITDVDNDTLGPNGLPSVTSTIIIRGHGAIIERSTATGIPPFRLMHVAEDTGDLTLTDLTLRGGHLPPNANFRAVHGGAIRSLGALTLSNVTVSGNTAPRGGGLATGDRRVFAGFPFSIGTVTLTDVTISGNTAAEDGGGQLNYGTATLTRVTISGNTADSGGGMRSFFDAELNLTDSTISRNTAGALGGGLEIYGPATLTGVTVDGNTAGSQGGGLNIQADQGKTVALTNVTISGNSTDFSGGGLAVLGEGTTTLTNVTVTGNSSGFRAGGIANSAATAIRNSIIVGNTAATMNPDCIVFMPYTTNGKNLVGSTAQCNAGDIAFAGSVGSILGPLADNGGRTHTHALLGTAATNPAIDAALLADCPPADQRGFFRPQGAGCDIGAFEQPAPGTITGMIFNDANKSGAREPGEGGLGGVRVFLDLDGDRQYDAGEPTTFSGPTGAYSLLNAPSGRVCAETPASRTATSPPCAIAIIPSAGATASGVDIGSASRQGCSGSQVLDTIVALSRDGGGSYYRPWQIGGPPHPAPWANTSLQVNDGLPTVFARAGDRLVHQLTVSGLSATTPNLVLGFDHVLGRQTVVAVVTADGKPASHMGFGSILPNPLPDGFVPDDFALFERTSGQIFLFNVPRTADGGFAPVYVVTEVTGTGYITTTAWIAGRLNADRTAIQNIVSTCGDSSRAGTFTGPAASPLPGARPVDDMPNQPF
jgi:hypothetical protein